MSVFQDGKRPAGGGDESAEEPAEGALNRDGSAAGASDVPEGAESGARRDEDPDGVAAHANTPVPSLDELRAALEWAFGGEEIEAAVLERFAQHARLVLAGNQRLNLTAIVEPREVAAKHYLDSWRTTRLLPLGGRSLLDLGTGGGFPGLPVALAEPQARVVLLDSRAKRVEFVKETITALDARNASAVAERAEDHLARHKYDIVLVRAVSSVRENVRLLRKVRHSHKDLVMLKGPSWSREARAAEREAERLGFRLDTVWEHKLPGDMGDRAFLVYRAPGGQGL